MARLSDDSLLSEMEQMVEEANEAVRDLHSRWDRFLEFYQGIQDTEIGLAGVAGARTDWAPVNVIFSTTETKVPILSDSVPMWFVVSPDGRHDREAEALTKALQSVWYTRNVGRQYEMMLRDQVLLGTGFLKAWWNPTIGPLVPNEDGELERLGDVDVSWQDPFSVRPDPGARSLEECEYLVLTSDITKQRAARLWEKFDAKKAEEVQGSSLDTEQNIWTRAVAWVMGRGPGPLNNTVTPLYRIHEVYYDGGAKLCIYSGKNLIYDGDNPTPGQQYPIVAFPMYERGYSIFGMADTPHIIDIQTQYNRITYRIAHNARLMANNLWKVSDPSIKVSNVPGSEVYVPPGQSLEPLIPGQMPPYIFAFREALKQDIDMVTGVHDVTRGLRPGSIQSGIGIQQLQEAANTRLRHTAQSNSRYMERLGRLVFDFQQSHYREERTMTYMEGSRPQRVYVTPDMYRAPQMNPEALASGEPEEGAFEAELGPEEVVEQEIHYEVVVPRVGDLPMSASARAELALRTAAVQFPDGPAIDRQALLEQLKFPNATEILQRMQQMQSASVQGQMLAQQEAAGMPPEAAQAAPAAPEAAPQDPTMVIQQLLEALEQVLTPADMQLLDSILTHVEQGIPPSQSEQGWIASLQPDVQQMVAELIMLYLQMGRSGEEISPEMALVRPGGV